MLRSLRNRLTLLFSAIVLCTVGGLYLAIVPPLESRLRAERIDTLAQAARKHRVIDPIAHTVGSTDPQGRVDELIATASGAAGGVRVTLLQVAHGGATLQLAAVADSTGDLPRAGIEFPVAYVAAQSGHMATGTETAAVGPLGEAARPLFLGREVAKVVVFSTPLADVAQSVAVVRRRFIIASGVALALAILAGFLVARWLAARVRRLEDAVDRVAAGELNTKVPTEGEDELGQLARALSAMQQQLSTLDRARKQFIATASHELRTPIMSLSGFVELLEDEDLDEETRGRFLVQVREQIERLRKLSVDLLDLSRLESGSLELRPEPVDVAELTRSVAAEFEPALAEHDSNLELRLPPQPTEVRCDPVRVAQIMRILIDNAITHTPPGTQIHVAAGPDDGHVRLVVRDAGKGISRGAMSRIFEPFYTSNDAQGSGLGLAIASELAERMDGRLAVDSIPGRTVFTLELPA